MSKNFKAKNIFIFGLILLFVLTTFGCGETTKQTEQPKDTSQPTEKANESIDLVWCAGSPGGFWSQLGTMFCEGFKDNISGVKYTVVPGGGAANPISVSKEQSNSGMALTTGLRAASKGESPYDKEFPDGIKNIFAIGRINVPSAGHFMVSKDIVDKYNLESVSDIFANKVPLKLNAGQRGSGDEAFSSRVLAAYNVTYKAIESWGGQLTFSDYGEAFDRYINGAQCNAIGFIENIGNAEVKELCSSRESVFLPLDKDVAEKLVLEFGYMVMDIPSNTYAGQTNPFTVVYEDAVVIVDDTISDNVVYQMTKVFLENKERWAETHAGISSFEPSVAGEGISISLAKGAERAYKELGYIK